ncbi:MAG: hypothetical protein IK123_09520, partial [Lachnospiraceae bacterium]|nr:hypothetical protein [Lachnospiraceae bacterium]
TFASLLDSAFRNNVEARMYSLAALFVLLVFLESYYILTRKNAASYILFTLFSLCAAYTHYYALISVAMIYAALLILVIAKKENIKRVLIIYAATIIGYLPWLGKMFTTFERTADSFWMTDYDGIYKSLSYIYYSVYPWFSLLLFILTATTVLWNIITDIKGEHHALSDFSIWCLIGLSATLMTILAGQLISVLIRPSYITRYIYPISITLWLILGACIGRIKSAKIRISVFAVILLLTGLICGPSALRTALGDHSADKKNTETWDTMQTMIDKDDIIITDIDHMSWTLLDYYMPDNEHIFDDTHDIELSSEKKYWFLTNDTADGTDMSWTKQYDLNADLKIDSGILGTTEIDLYELSPQAD